MLFGSAIRGISMGLHRLGMLCDVLAGLSHEIGETS